MAQEITKKPTLYRSVINPGTIEITNRIDKEGNTFYYVMYDTDKYVRFKYFSSVIDFISSNF